MKTAGFIGLAGAVMVGAVQTAAIETLSTSELATHCAQIDRAPKSEDAVFCVRYVQGFVDGAVATDARVTLNVAAEYSSEPSFTQRAARTRISQRLERIGPTVYAEFCLGEPVPLRALVDLVARDLSDEELVREVPVARELVFATLRKEFPCQSTDDD